MYRKWVIKINEKTIGERMKKLRNHLRMNQQTLADKAGFTKSMISKIENGKVSTPISTLSKVAKALDVNLSWFFEEENEEDLVIINKENRKLANEKESEYGYSYFSLANKKRYAKIQPFMVIIPPSTVNKKPFIHEEEEFVMVVEGVIDFYYDGAHHSIEEGDSFYYSGKKPHMMLAKNGKEAKVLVIVIQ